MVTLGLLGLTLRQGQIWSPVHLYRKNCRKVIEWEKLTTNDHSG